LQMRPTQIKIRQLAPSSSEFQPEQSSRKYGLNLLRNHKRQGRKEHFLTDFAYVTLSFIGFT